MSVGLICSRVLATASARETARVAAQRMAEYDVGTLVVLDPDGSGRPAGVVTDRDIATRCVAQGLDADAIPVSTLMTTPVRSIAEDASVQEATAAMANAGTRRLVVTGAKGRAVGILSLDDVLEGLTEQVAAIGRLLERQGSGIPA